MMIKKQLVKVYVDNKEKTVMDKICRSNDISISSFVRTAIQKEITRYVAEGKVK